MSSRTEAPPRATLGDLKARPWAPVARRRPSLSAGPPATTTTTPPPAGVPVGGPARPGPLALASNLLRDAAGAVPTMLAAGAVLVPPEETERRLAVCRRCPGGFFRAEDQVCLHRKCGCSMPLKARLVGFNCPIGAWDRPELVPVLPPECLGRFAGRRAWVVGCGPSLEAVDLRAVRGSPLVVLAVNHAAEHIRPDVWIGFDEPHHFDPSWWLDSTVLKVSDAKWRTRAHTLRGLDTPAASCPNVAWVRPGSWASPEGYWSGPDAPFCRGHCNSFAAVFRVARDLGLVELNLIGVDFRADAERHYAHGSGRTPRTAHKARQANRKYRALAGHLAELAPSVGAAGLAVWQCTPGSALAAFPARTIEDVLRHPQQPQAHDQGH
jgi:hypothetical protein